jgi:hypothetical protein
VLVLHGAGVDHREPEACFEPVFDYPRASLAVLDDAGHAVPHEQPDLLRVHGPISHVRRWKLTVPLGW